MELARKIRVIEKPSISIVIPVYNEEESIPLLYRRVCNACDPLGKPYEIIFVDDGSRDGTFGLLRGIHQQDGRVRVIRFRKNYGQTPAMAAGFEFAQGKIIVSMDGDLQNDPADIPRLLAKLEEGYDVVCGWRKVRRDKLWTRRIPSVVANWVISRVTGVTIHDNGCSLKAYRAPIIKNVALYGEMHRFIPAMSTLSGARVTEIVVSHHPRHFGKSKYGVGRIWKVALDITSVKMITGFVSRPSLWFGLLGLPSIVLGLSVLSVGGVLNSDALIEEWIVMFTVAFLFLFLGAHLLAMGIIGELSLKTGNYVAEDTLRPTIRVLEGP